jgi:hypothetical protein
MLSGKLTICGNHMPMTRYAREAFFNNRKQRGIKW